MNNGTGLCGAGFRDEIRVVNYTADHTDCDAVLRFTGIFDQIANDESWGISELLVEYDSSDLGFDEDLFH